MLDIFEISPIDEDDVKSIRKEIRTVAKNRFTIALAIVVLLAYYFEYSRK